MCGTASEDGERERRSGGESKSERHAWLRGRLQQPRHVYVNKSLCTPV